MQKTKQKQEMAREVDAKNKVARLVQALEGKIAEKPKKRPRGKPRPAEQLAPYYFPKGKSGNPSGRPRDHAREAVNRLAHTSPPLDLCAMVGVAPGSTWIEAIVHSLAMVAVTGDVAAAREVLGAFGIGSAAQKDLFAAAEPKHVNIKVSYVPGRLGGLGADDFSPDALNAVADGPERERQLLDRQAQYRRRLLVTAGYSDAEAVKILDILKLGRPNLLLADAKIIDSAQ